MQEDAVLHIVLFQPEIPPNTGNVGRLCAFTCSRLHLIHPLGFEITDRHLRRAGMDYWRTLDLHQHASWDAFLESPARPKRMWLMTTKTERSYWDARFEPEDGLIFGRETEGAPEWMHTWAGERRLRIPQWAPTLRSLNLSTSVGIAAYEVLRQLREGK